MATASADAVTALLDIEPLTWETVYVPIEGRNAVIVHAFGVKARRQLPGHPQAEKKSRRGSTRNPEEEARAGLYLFADGTPGFPSGGFWKAMIRSVGTFVGKKNLSMIDAHLVFNVLEDGFDAKTNIPLVRIEGQPELREDYVRLPSGGAEVRWRYEFKDWSAVLPIEYCANRVSEPTLVSIVDGAGRVGVGDWRPEKSGQFGTWTVRREG